MALFICEVCLLALSHRNYQFIGKEILLPDTIQAELIRLGKLSLASNDAPVSALILYQNKIIGRGYNTVFRDTAAGEHAEINAISDAMKHFPRNQFGVFSRDSLVLITTYEPCLMCKGAILECNIKKVIFLKPKPLTNLMRDDIRSVRYLWRRMKGEPESLQDSLFYMFHKYH